MENSLDFRAETVTEEYARLIGRLEAFKGYLDASDRSLIECDLCKAMLGLSDTVKNETEETEE